jgi:hypothetical protein
MAARVTAAEVKEIIETDLTDAAIAPMIAMATMEVDERLVDLDLSAARLKEIERWLAAHFISSSLDPRTKSEGAGSVSQSFEGQQGTGLKATRYGQQAIVLDTTGTLAASSEGGTGAAEISLI